MSLHSEELNLAIGGIRLAAIAAGIRYANRLDLVLIEIAAGSSCAGVFTRNAFCAAPVRLARDHLAGSAPRYFLVNTGNANAGTGEPGRQAAIRCCQALAQRADVNPEQVLPFSTGVIGEPLPEGKIIKGLDAALAALAPGNWQAVAKGIMTTDTVPKLRYARVELGGGVINIAGIAKGAGMIKPNMATMLAYVFTDAVIATPRLQEILQQAVARSFNRITVDGDTSTNDCAMLVATGASGIDEDSLGESERAKLQQAVTGLFTDLATDLIRDAEGATKFITIDVVEGRSSEECLAAAYAVAESPLVKTACYASDPNWGRILAAVGRAGIPELDLDKVNITLGDTPLIIGGTLNPEYREELGQAAMNGAEICIRIELGRGNCCERVWTSDLSPEYVSINADYRT